MCEQFEVFFCLNTENSLTRGDTPLSPRDQFLYPIKRQVTTYN